MTTYHEFDRNGKHYRLVYDETHETVGPYCYGTAEEDAWAEQQELANLENGTWVVLGCIVTKPCPGPHCAACGGTVQVDSLWGIVIENDTATVERFAMDNM